jgi:hypothetical protein
MSSLGYNAYTTYVAVKMHFTSKKYNYFRHKGSKISEGALRKNNDRYWFMKLQDKYSEDDLLSFFLAQYTANHMHNYWVGDSFGDKCQELYHDYQKRMGQFTRFVNQDIADLYNTYNHDEIYKVSSGYPKIITSYLAGKISLETLIVLDELNGWVGESEALVGLVGEPLLNKIEKYRPFLNYNIVPIRKKYNQIFT